MFKNKYYIDVGLKIQIKIKDIEKHEKSLAIFWYLQQYEHTSFEKESVHHKYAKQNFEGKQSKKPIFFQ